MISQRNYIALLLGLVVLSPLGIDLFLPTLFQVADGLHTRVSNVQFTIPLFLLIMGVGQLFSGPLVDNFGRKPIALIGILMYVVASVMAAMATSWPWFLAARILQGTAVCCSAVVANSGVRDRLEGEEAAKAYGFLNGSLNIVPALAPLLGGALASYWGWHAPFWFLAIYATVLGGAVLLWLPETRPASTQVGPLLPLAVYATLLANRQFLAFTLAIASALGVVLTYVSLAPVVLMAQSGLSAFSFAILFGMNGLWIMLVSAGVNRVIRKVGRPCCLAAGSLCMLLAASMLLLEALLPSSLAQHWLGFMLPVMIGVAGLAFVIGPATSFALAPWQHRAGVASALLGFIQMTGAAGGSMLILALPLTAKHALAIIMLIAALITCYAWRTSLRIRGIATPLYSS